MLSRATVRRKTGATTTDADGFEVPALVVAYTDRPCRIAAWPAQPVAVEVAERRRRRGRRSPRVAHLPHDTDLADGDLIEVTAGDWTGLPCGMWSRPTLPTSRPPAVCP
jgi:hypothetical protein